jgi:hypothetical protein
MTRVRIGFVWVVTVFSVQLGSSSSVHADPIPATYTTTGSISSTGIAGAPTVSFQGVTDGTLTTGQPFSLGNFIVNVPPAGAATTYWTSFQITFNVTSASGDPALLKATPITLGGTLTNEFAVGGTSLVASFSSLRPPSPGVSILNAYTVFFTDASSVTYGLYPTNTLITLDPTSANGGVVGVRAELDIFSVPEPTPFAMLVVSGMILALRRYVGGNSASKMQTTWPR